LELGTGKMPVPQEFSVIVGWASCPPWNCGILPELATGKMPVPQEFSIIVGWASCPPWNCGILPALELRHLARPGIAASCPPSKSV
jgi:hypothetical protein